MVDAYYFFSLSIISIISWLILVISDSNANTSIKSFTISRELEPQEKKLNEYKVSLIGKRSIATSVCSMRWPMDIGNDGGLYISIVFCMQHAMDIGNGGGQYISLVFFEVNNIILLPNCVQGSFATVLVG